MKIKGQKIPCPTCGAPRRMLHFAGADLRAARKAAGLSLRQMSERTGISHSHLHDVENERRTATPATVALYEALSAEPEGARP